MITKIGILISNCGKSTAWLSFWLEANGYKPKLKQLSETEVKEVHNKLMVLFRSEKTHYSKRNRKKPLPAVDKLQQ